MMMAVGPVITHIKSKTIRISCGPKAKALGLFWLEKQPNYSHSEGPLLRCLAITLQYNAGTAASNIGRGQIPEGLVLLSPDEKELCQWLG